MASFAQSRSVKDTTTSATTALAYSTANLTPGSLLSCVCVWNSGSLTCSVADSANGSWTPIGSAVAGVTDLLGFQAQMFYLPKNTSAVKPTVTMTISAATTTYRLLAILEHIGPTKLGAGANYLEEHAGTTSKTVSLTPRTSKDAVLSFIICAGSTPAVSAPFTQREFVNFDSNIVATDEAPTGGSSLTCTYTSISSGTENLLGIAALTPQSLIHDGGRRVARNSLLRRFMPLGHRGIIVPDHRIWLPTPGELVPAL